VSDHHARLEAQREFSRPLVVEAGAGTGKTATLVARVLAWSLGPGWTRAAERLRGRPARVEEGGRGEEDRVAAATLGGVVAITFTEAAAAEMAERVVAGLAQVELASRPAGLTVLDHPSSSYGSDTVRRRAAALLGAADHLQVRTIHSFCRKLLAEHPFEAGVHPHFTVDADGGVLREVVEETVEAALADAYGDPGDPDFLALAARGRGPVEIAAAVSELAAAGWTGAALAGDPLSPARRGELVERLWDAVNRLLTLLEVRRMDRSRARNAAALLDRLGGLRRRLRGARRPGAAPCEIADLRAWLDETLPPHLTDHLRLWGRGDTANQAERERLSSIRHQLMPLADALYRLRRHAGRLDPELLTHGRRVVAPLLERVRAAMRARGALGFADLLREAGTLAAGHPGLVAQLRRRTDQLLVDEFQDTDRVQCDLIRRLALEGPAGERPGLFVVGDPKQSIYGWRNADLAAYEDFVAAVVAAGGEVLTLDENFRSTPAVLAEVERVIGPVMVRESGLQPQFRPLRATSLGARASRPLPEAGGTPALPAVEHWVSWRPDPEDPRRPAAGSAQETSELEAGALAADLRELRRAGVAWSDVGILLRSLTDLEVYLAALREAAVPFVVSRDRQYYRRREILDAAALVRAVLEPADLLALLTFLRSAAVGVPDAALAPLWRAGLPGRLAALDGEGDDERLAEIRALVAGLEVPREVPGIDRVAGWENNLAYAAACLSRLRRAFASEPADVFVDALRRLTLFEATEAARYLGGFRLANLERFFAELATALEEEAGDRHRVLRRLRRRIAEEFEAEEAHPAEAAADAVLVTSIHKAKGLEFRHVYLLQTHKEAGTRSAVTVEIGELGGRALPPDPPRGGRVEYRLFGAATAGFDELVTRREEVARAELVRSLYVAMTRASERLVIAGRRPLDGERAPLARASTHLDLLLYRQGAAPSPTELVDLWQSGGDRRRDGDVLWRLPGRKAQSDESDLSDLSDLSDSGLELPSLEAVRSVDERLRRERAQAALRMARPFRQVASKLAAELFAPDSPSPEERVEPVRRSAALAAGSALHRLLETFDLAADPEGELARQRRRLPELVELFDGDGDALARAQRLFDRFAEGPLLARFLAISRHAVARELPVLLPPGDDQAVGYLTGIVDLVYRDPASEALVVADFKTDLVPTAATIAEHARRYAPQGDVYARAVGEALGLAERPRFELWFLDAGHVEVVA